MLLNIMLKHRKVSEISTPSPKPEKQKITPTPKKSGLLTIGDGISPSAVGISANDDLELEDNENRSMIVPKALEKEEVKDLIQLLINWVNDVIHAERIIVQDIEEDFYDGQVLHKLIEKLTGRPLKYSGNTLLPTQDIVINKVEQKKKLQAVLECINDILKFEDSAMYRWSVDSIYSKNVVAILHLLIAIALHFRAPIRMPENVVIDVIIVTKEDGILVKKVVAVQMTAEYGYDQIGVECEKDAFDTLFDKENQPLEKLDIVKANLMKFTNTHLEKLKNKHVKEVIDLEKQLSDGVYFCLLVGILEGYFIPLYEFHLTPESFEEKVHNVSFAFQLMYDAGLPKMKPRPEDIVNGDLKSILRVIYSLFLRYKGLQ